jgi:hypothetical protein
MSKSCVSRVTVLAGLVLGLGAALPSAGGPNPKAPLRVRVPDAAGMAVRRALLAARQRIGGARCREVLSEFRSDGPNRPLDEVLVLLGRTPEQHLDSLTFEDGSQRAPCASPGILAFTHVGSHTIHVCASQFKSATRNDPAYAEMILIHEMLHTLGLGENPPTSLDITARVTERCGEGPARRARSAP